MRASTLGAIGILIATPVLAQYPENDSARTAREAYRQAISLLRKHDSAAARALVRRAFLAWPVQPFYAIGYASLSARAADTSETIRALEWLARMGLTHDLAGDQDFAALRDAPSLRQVARRLAANALPVVRSAVAAALPASESDFFPEGLSHDSVEGVWYVASVRHRKVARVGRDGSARDVVTEGQDGLWSALGVRADRSTSTLWVATAALPQMLGYVAADSGRSAIFAFELPSGRLKARYFLPTAPPGHLLGDLVVAPNGDVYATDSQDPVIWRIRRGSDEVQEFLRHPLFRSLQGPAVDPTGRKLYVADFSHGVLVVDLNTRQVLALTPPQGETVLGIDGLVWHRGTLVGVQNGVAPARIVRLVLDKAGGRITKLEVLDRHLPLVTEPTIGTVWGDRFFYVANSQWGAYDDVGRLKPGSRLEPPVILGLRLP